MRVLINDQKDLTLILTTETVNDLAEVKDIQEFLSIHLPGLTLVDNPTTMAPIFKLGSELWWLPNFLTVNPLETLRDTGMLRLFYVS